MNNHQNNISKFIKKDKIKWININTLMNLYFLNNKNKKKKKIKIKKIK